MAKRQEDEAPKGAPAWQSTFADLMNLLLCFFVLLFSMSSVDAQKFELVVASFSDTFSIFSAGTTSIGDGMMVGNGISQLTNLDNYLNTIGQMAKNDEAEMEEMDDTQTKIEEEGLRQSEELSERIEEALEENDLTKDVDMDITAQYVQLTMNGALLFDSGSASLRKEAEPVMDKIGLILESYAAGTIEIEGHTDNIPISTSQYASNNELSAARAISVFNYLIGSTSLDPADIKNAGRGEYVPIADNATPEGRSKNRRVEIKIYNQLYGD